MVSRTTDDMFSSARSQHLQIFNQVESFQRNMMKQINNMFSFGGFGSMGSPSDFMSSGTQSTRNQGPQRMISKTYVYQTKKDASGNMYHEKYFSHNYAMKGSDGTTIVERQEGYHNSGNNLQRIAEERRINSKGKKLTQERIKGQDYVAKTIQYNNMGEEEINHFDHAWDSHTKQLGFYRDYGNMIGHNGNNGSSRNRVPQNHDEYVPKQRRPASSHQRTQPSSSGQSKPKRSSPQTLALMDGNNNQNHARVRRSDIQPTIPNRRGIEVQIPEQRYEPAHEPVRPQHAVRQQQEPRVNHNHHANEHQERPVTRERVVNQNQGERRQAGSVRNDGNFKNKVVTNAMPLAG